MRSALRCMLSLSARQQGNLWTPASHDVRLCLPSTPTQLFLPPDCGQLHNTQGNNTILADEMGLGKTVQCVSLVGLLAQHMSVRGPFLLVVPLSTVPNWIKEFRKWVPMVSV